MVTIRRSGWSRSSEYALVSEREDLVYHGLDKDNRSSMACPHCRPPSPLNRALHLVPDESSCGACEYAARLTTFTSRSWKGMARPGSESRRLELDRRRQYRTAMARAAPTPHYRKSTSFVSPGGLKTSSVGSLPLDLLVPGQLFVERTIEPKQRRPLQWSGPSQGGNALEGPLGSGRSLFDR